MQYVSYETHTAEIFRNFKIITIYKLYEYSMNQFQEEKNKGLEHLPAHPTRRTEKWRMITQQTTMDFKCLNLHSHIC